MSTILQERYRLLKMIGKGGMADVYLALDEVLKRKVAIKVLKGELSGDKLSVLRFKREAMAATKLIHPNIVEVYDVGQYKGHNYIVMEYVKGNTLKNLIKKRKFLSVDETVFIMKQLLSAILEAHKAGIIHRDIKPQNVIIKDDGTLKILDFGIALAHDAIQITNSHSIMGSVHYLAPEISSGKPATMQSDIYALGVVMYELLSGEVPFKSENAVDVALKHLNNKFPSVRDFDSNIPQSLENIITRCVAKDPKARYQNVYNMWNDLNNYLSDDPKNKKKLIIDDSLEIKKGLEKFQKTKNKNKNKNIDPFFTFVLGTVAFFVMVVFLIAFLYLTGVLSFRNKYVKVPELKNLTVLEAQDTLQSMGLFVDLNNIKRELTENVEKGKIISYSPALNTKVEKGSKIDVVVSEGKYAVMKNYVGMDLKLAKQDINSNFQYVNIIAIADSTSAKKPGTIIKQELLVENQKFDPNVINDIKLIYAPLPNVVIRHDILNMTITEAKNYLEDLGMRVVVEKRDHTNLTEDQIANIDPEKVIDCNPKPGTSYIQEEGNVITLYHY